jgi:hypothetical protein
MLDAFIREHVKVVMVGRPNAVKPVTCALDAGHAGACITDSGHGMKATGATVHRFSPGQSVIADGIPAEIVGYWRNNAWVCRELEHRTTWAVDADRIVPADA